jgi:hypothetical protein
MQWYMNALGGMCLIAAVAAPVRADDAATAKAILAKAIEAAGGEARLMKFKAGVYKSKGILYGAGAGDLSYTQETAVQFPKRYRVAVTSDILKKTIVLNGAKGWVWEDGITEELTGDELANQQEALYAIWVGSLIPLSDSAFTLVALGDSKAGERDVEGIKVRHKGHADLKLFFDKQSSLLLKIERQIRSAIGREEMTQEIQLGSFKEIDGIQEPMKVAVKINGSLAAEEEILELKHLEKLDEKLFAKP